ncbi:MAG: hypothetical protein J6T24_06870, partial [Clostridia bacterium]|nr:hypothetical protein [Clostridia bacterium]
MLTLLLINYLFSGVVILPAFVIYLITGMASLVGAVTFFVLFLVLPALSLAICCLLGWVLALISSRMRHKNLVTLLLSLSFLVLYFVGMGAFSTMMETVDPTALDIRPIVSSVTPYLLVFNWIGAAVCGNLPAGGLFLLFAVAVCAGVMLFLSKSYIAIVTANRGTVRVKYREKAVRQSSPMWALIRKELRRFTGSAAYMMNEGLGLVFAVLLSILLLVKSGDLSTVFASEDLLPFAFLLDALPVAIGGVLCIMSSMVMISAPSVSLEGRSVWISQSMPIPPDKPLLAKVYMHILVATPFFLLSSLLSVIALRPDPFSGVMIFVLPLISNIFCAHVGVFFGILFPRLDWINEVVPLKQGAAVGFTMLTMMVLTVLLYIGMILLALIGVPGGLCMLAVSLLFFFGSLGLHAYLVRGGARRFANLS